jgi:hypothetical protein
MGPPSGFRRPGVGSPVLHAGQRIQLVSGRVQPDQPDRQASVAAFDGEQQTGQVRFRMSALCSGAPADAGRV